jgi:hypothetical protein
MLENWLFIGFLISCFMIIFWVGRWIERARIMICFNIVLKFNHNLSKEEKEKHDLIITCFKSFYLFNNDYKLKHLNSLREKIFYESKK